MGKGRWVALVAALAMVLVAARPAPVDARSGAVEARVTAASPARAGDGFRLEAHTTYALDPAAQVVHVRVDADLKNTTPDRVVGNYLNQRYFPALPAMVVAEATNLAARKSDGTPLTVTTEPTESPLFEVASIDLAPDVYYPNSQAVTFTYDIPAVAPRTQGVTRVNKAFATFPVYTWGDPGISTVEVLIPEEFEVELIGGAMEEGERDGHQVFSSGPIADVDSFWIDVVARNDEQLVRRSVDLGEHKVEVQAWPGDDEWADLVASDVEEGIPALERLIGSEWPVDRDLDIVETVAPYLYGYAGWYEAYSSLIEIGDELESAVILHELAHAWFNDELFRERWISEGLADVFAARVMEELGKEPEEPKAVRPDDPGRVRLNQWGDPDLEDGGTRAQESYGYNASFALVDAIADEIGTEQLTAVTTAAIARSLPYTAELVPGVLTEVPSWHTLLDLFEEVGGSKIAEAQFRALVVTPEQAKELDARTAARATYAALEEDSGGWAPPRYLRRAMSEWDFEDVDELVEQSRSALDQRAELEDALAPADLEVPEAAQAAYEGALEPDDLAAQLDDAVVAGAALADAVEADRAGPGPLGFLGLLGGDVDDDLERAQARFRAGKWGAAAAAADDVDDAYAGAAIHGLLRLLAVGVLLLAGVLLGRWLRRRRATRATRATAEAGDSVEDDGQVEGVPALAATSPGEQPEEVEDTTSGTPPTG